MNGKMNDAMARMQTMQQAGCILTTRELVEELLPKRNRYAHKGEFGRMLLLCGSVGYTGAPALAANAALRSGAGLIEVGVPAAVYPIVAMKLDEPMVFPLPCDRDGRLSKKAIPEILARLKKCDACLLGPGLGLNKDSLRIVQAVLENCTVPLVLDADGINALEGHIDMLGHAKCPVILTPHDGEFARLGGDTSSKNRFSSVKAFAEKTNTVVALKGHRTLIVSAESAYCNTTGNPGMATGGSGDVLAGILTAFLGQGAAPVQAAAAAAYVHGEVGDYCAKASSEAGMTPMDMVANLPLFLK